MINTLTRSLQFTPFRVQSVGTAYRQTFWLNRPARGPFSKKNPVLLAGILRISDLLNFSILSYTKTPRNFFEIKFQYNIKLIIPTLFRRFKCVLCIYLSHISIIWQALTLVTKCFWMLEWLQKCDKTGNWKRSSGLIQIQEDSWCITAATLKIMGLIGFSVKLYFYRKLSGACTGNL